jgi:hypothetical protein
MIHGPHMPNGKGTFNNRMAPPQAFIAPTFADTWNTLRIPSIVCGPYVSYREIKYLQSEAIL